MAEGGSRSGNTSLVKAKLEVKPETVGGLNTDQKVLHCRFNPKEYSISKTMDVQRSSSRKAKKAAKGEFVGTGPRTLQLELFLDGWDRSSGSKADQDVSKDVELLFTWMTATPKSIKNNKPKPPVIVFHWGNDNSKFDAVLKSANAKYTMFRGDGIPVRATVACTFEEVPDKWYGTNPTSGGPPGRRTHVVRSGETLPHIAYGEYENPNLWRGIAEANGIDDPLRVPPGTELLIPLVEEAAAVSTLKASETR